MEHQRPHLNREAGDIERGVGLFFWKIIIGTKANTSFNFLILKVADTLTDASLPVHGQLLKVYRQLQLLIFFFHKSSCTSLNSRLDFEVGIFATNLVNGDDC